MKVSSFGIKALNLFLSVTLISGLAPVSAFASAADATNFAADELSSPNVDLGVEDGSDWEDLFDDTRVSISGASVSGIADSYGYTADFVCPSFEVSLDGTKLRPDVDYEFSFSDNIDVGQATLTIEGVGNYKGTCIKTFAIVPQKVDVPSAASFTYDGAYHSPVESDERYIIGGTSRATEAGEYEVTVVVSNGNYVWADGTSDIKTLRWSIAKAKYDMSGVSFSDATVTYSGKSHYLEVSGSLPEGVSVSYEGNGAIDAGSYKVSAFFAGDSANYEPVPAMSAILTVDPANILQSAVAAIPAQTHTGFAIEPTLNLTYGDDVLVEGADYEVSYEDNVEVGTATVTVIGKGNFEGSCETTFEIVAGVVDLSGATISGLSKSYEYTGDCIEPFFEVTVDGKELVRDADYEVSFSGNLDAGMATLTVSGINGYKGTLVRTFVVEPQKVEVPTAKSFTYDGEYHSAVPSDERWIIGGVSRATEAGEYEVTVVVSNGNYVWADGTSETKIIAWSIDKAAYDMSGVFFEDETVIYDGKAHYVYVSGDLPEGLSVSYAGNGVIDAGAYEVMVSFSGDFANYEEVAPMSAVLIVEPADIMQAFIAAVGPQPWTGSFAEPKLTVSFNGMQLAEGSDYEVSYSGNDAPGTAKATVSGKGNFQGEAEIEFEIVRESVSVGKPVAAKNLVYTGFEQEGVFAGEGYMLSGSISATDAGSYSAVATLLDGFTWSDGSSDPVDVAWSIAAADISEVSVAAVPAQLHTGSAIEPELSLTFNGIELSEGADYEVTYRDNVAVGTAIATISGKGNFEGLHEAAFEIVAGVIDLSGATISGLSESYEYTGDYIEPFFEVTVDGKALVRDADYEVAFSGNLDAGTATLIVAGINGYEGAIVKTFSIEPADISQVFIANVDSQLWTGSAIEPKLSLSFNGMQLIEGSDYEVSYESNIAAGTARATVFGRSNFQGEAEIEFEIVAVSGTWKKDATGWWYQRADGTWPASCWEDIDGKRYHFDKNGYMQTGWLWDGAWYCLGSDGALRTGWLWDGAWYYMDPTKGGRHGNRLAEP